MKFKIGKKYRIIDNEDWKDRILYYVGKSIREKGLHYFESPLLCFHLNKTFDSVTIPIANYKFINVSEEEELQKKEEIKKKLEQEISERQAQLDQLTNNKQ